MCLRPNPKVINFPSVLQDLVKDYTIGSHIYVVVGDIPHLPPPTLHLLFPTLAAEPAVAQAQLTAKRTRTSLTPTAYNTNISGVAANADHINKCGLGTKLRRPDSSIVLIQDLKPGDQLFGRLSRAGLPQLRIEPRAQLSRCNSP